MLSSSSFRLPTRTALSTCSRHFSTTSHLQHGNSSGSSPNTLPTREANIARLSSSGEIFDVLVVGGGATGAGTALDATTRGLSTALVERGDFSSETSSRSTKLIWAGIRYIATATSQLLRIKNFSNPVGAVKDFWGEFKMVLGAHRERRALLENNPHLTNWVPIAVPMNTWVTWPPPFGHPIFAIAPLVLPAVMKFYDSMSGFTCPPSHIMSQARAKRKFSQLDEDLKYVQVFYEGQHNDARTNLAIALSAAEKGAAVANHTEMVNVLFDDTTGKANGIEVLDRLTNDTYTISAKSIIFAGGPFTDSMRKLENPAMKPAVNGAAGTHIVLPGYYSPKDIGMLDINTSDGRFLFFLPWQGSVLVGTTDRKGDPVSSPGPPEDEIQWILNEVEKYLDSSVRVRRADVLSAWQGWRPLASDPHAAPDAPVSRDHIISINQDTGITFVTGGKWTTYREMAEDVVDKVMAYKQISTTHQGTPVGPCVTLNLPLRGGFGYTKNTAIKLVQKFGISEETAQHLARTYGTHAFDVCYLSKPTGKAWPRFGQVLVDGYPFVEAEIEYACKYEYVRTLKDMLTLRCVVVVVWWCGGVVVWWCGGVVVWWCGGGIVVVLSWYCRVVVLSCCLVVVLSCCRVVVLSCLMPFHHFLLFLPRAGFVWPF
jgi:glycerol-3-phosphate dehydrogenase